MATDHDDDDDDDAADDADDDAADDVDNAEDAAAGAAGDADDADDAEERKVLIFTQQPAVQWSLPNSKVSHYFSWKSPTFRKSSSNIAKSGWSSQRLSES